MEALKGYCYSLIVITVCTTVVMLIAPEKSGLMKYVKWIAALSVTATLIIPLRNIGGEIKIDLDSEYATTAREQKSGRELILSALSDEIADSVENILYERFELVCKSVKVEINSDETENVSIEKITVYVPTKSRFLISDIRTYLKELYLCEIEVRSSDD